jgi:hypothetical protein
LVARSIQRFELFKDARGEFRFHLKAANGEIIASGEGYKSKAGRGERHQIGADQRARGRGGGPDREVRSASGEFVAFVEEFVDLATRRRATVLADGTAHGSD